MLRYRNLVILVTVAALCVSLAGCGATPTQAPAAPTKAAEPTKVPEPTKAPEPTKTPAGPRTLTIAFGAIPTTADPAFDTGAWAMDAFDTVFDTLVIFKDGKLQASVAESWKTLSDTQWEFKLRKDIKFQNGEPMNAQAAKYSIERILLPANKSNWMSQLGPITKVEAVDDYTLRITTSVPVATLPQNLLVAYLVPPKYAEEVGLAKFAKAPVGSGPFKFDSMDPLTYFTVTAWPESWRWGGKKPGLDKVTWKKLPEDSTRVSALQAGEVDIGDNISPEQAEKLKGTKLQIISQPIAQTLVINLRSTWDTPIKSKLVRQALNYGVDKQSIIKSILLGNATQSQGQIIGPDAFGFNPNLKPYPYDPQKAKDLLKEAGYPDGFEITFNGTQGRYPKDKEVAEVVVAQLAQIGVKAKLEFVENAVFSTMTANGTAAPLHIYGWQYMPAMDISQPIPFLLCNTPRKNHCDPELDKAVAEMGIAMDPAVREKKAWTVAEILRENPPVIFLWPYQNIYGIQPYVNGYVPTAARRADLTKVTLSK